MSSLLFPEGTHYLYCRAYKEESGHTEKYGEWSEGFLLKVNIKTPNAPVVQKLQVKKNDVKIILGSNTEELDGYDVVAARSKDGDEPSDYIKVQCKYSGNSKELIQKGVPKGNWYIGVHGYKYLDGSNKKVRVPLEDVTEVKNGVRKQVSKKMFPGYVLIHMIMNDDTWYVVRNTRGVTTETASTAMVCLKTDCFSGQIIF